MTEHLTEDVREHTTRRFCQWCGKPTDASRPYCGECGRSLAGDVGAESNGQHEPTNGSASGPGHGYQAQAATPTGPPLYVYPGPYPVPSQDSNSNVGLIAGLVAAALLAAGVIAAIILLAASGGGSSPTVSTTRNAATVSPAITPPAGGLAVGRTAKSSAPKGTPAPATTSSSSSSSSAPTASAADAQSIKSAVSQHWSLISQGNFAGAFAQMDPNDFDRGSWISGEQASAPISASVSVGQPTISSATSANVPLLSLHTVSSDGCANWSGSYDMTKISGSWLISAANLQKTAC